MKASAHRGWDGDGQRRGAVRRRAWRGDRWGARSAWCISDRDLLCCAIAAFKWDRPWVVLFWVGGRAPKGKRIFTDTCRVGENCWWP